MPIAVDIRGVPRKDGEACPAFLPAAWWRASDLLDDVRFRVIDPNYLLAVACLDTAETQELQERFRARAHGNNPWQRDSERLDIELQKPAYAWRWWVVSAYEWESGLD